MSLIASTRFNNETLEQNQKYKDENGITGFIYCQRIRIKEQVPLNSLLYLVEMNNSTNQILGIALIKNAIATDKYYRVYSSSDFNRYIYKADHRFSRDELVVLNIDLVLALEQICFKGKTHLKRIPGISIISDKLLSLPVCKNINFKRELRAMFLQKYYGDTSKSNSSIDGDHDDAICF
jgi:hypothetical protein